MLLKRFLSIRHFSRFTQTLSQQIVTKEAPADSAPRRHEKHKKTITQEESVGPKLIYNDHYKIKYQRLDINDPQVSRLMQLVKSKKKLQRDYQIIVEGKQLICEAVQSHFRLNHLLFSHLDKIQDVVEVMGSSTGNVNFLRVPQQDLNSWSVLTTCPGVIGIFDKPSVANIKPNALPITIIGDNIREPNNVGAVVRLANALPATKVLLPKGCADPWDVKGIRGSSGSIFHMPTEDSLTWNLIDMEAKTDDSTLVLIADSNVSSYVPSKVLKYDEIPEDLIAGKDIYLVIGGETHGVSDDAKIFAKARDWRVINVPIDPTVDSLNTSNALAIILFELRRILFKGQ